MGTEKTKSLLDMTDEERDIAVYKEQFDEQMKIAMGFIKGGHFANILALLNSWNALNIVANAPKLAMRLHPDDSRDLTTEPLSDRIQRKLDLIVKTASEAFTRAARNELGDELPRAKSTFRGYAEIERQLSLDVP
ncbi:MAG: hypothetical protein L6Q57_04150 [Alphaproteobacteria bacterium]|nr:hypothetical protein [Alphaproteobacteria bacterium]